MKILIVSHYFAPHHGGIEVVAENQAKYLAKASYQISVLTSAINASKGLERSADNYNIYRVAANNIFEKKFGVPFPVFSPLLLFKSYRLVKKAEIVHVHDAFYLSSLAAALWSRILRRPLILTQHVDLVPHPKHSVRLIQKVVYKTTGAFVFRTSKRIVVLNSRVKQFLIHHGVEAEKIVFIPNGIDTDLFRPGSLHEKNEVRKRHDLPKDKPLVLFVGRFVPKKGFNKLLQAGSQDYKIVFVGGSPPKKYIKDTHFIFLGALPSKQIAELYRACDIFILPSEGEGFPLSIQEAMASGLPVVTTNDEAYSIYKLNPQLLHLIQPTISNIVKQLEDLSNDRELRNNMGKYTRSYAVTNFNLAKNIKKLVKIYREILA